MQMNYAAVDKALERLVEIPVPADLRAVRAGAGGGARVRGQWDARPARPAGADGISPPTHPLYPTPR